MELRKEHIVLVENDPQVGEIIAQQTLIPLGYQVDVFESASSLLENITSTIPDLVITNLFLPGISGNDLIVALASQGVKVPVVVITPKGQESEALRAFRVGAVNFLTYPIREAEVVSVVEDTLAQYRKRIELDNYSRQLEKSNRELEQRIHECAEIFSIGKHVSWSESIQLLYEKIINISVDVTQAESGILVLIDRERGKYILRSHVNGDKELQSLMNQPYEDSFCSLIAASGQTISIHGDAVKRFNLLGDTGSILGVPIKRGEEVVGLIVVDRMASQPFTNNHKSLLELVAENASILINNSMQYKNLEQRLLHLQKSSYFARVDSDIKHDLYFQTGLELRGILNNLIESLDQLSDHGNRNLSPKQIEALNSVQVNADLLLDVADSMVSQPKEDKSNNLERIDLNELVSNLVSKSRTYAQVRRITIKSEFPAQPSFVMVIRSQIAKVIEGILSNALKYSPPNSKITITIERKDQWVRLFVKDQGEGIDESFVQGMFDKKPSIFSEQTRPFGGVGISLPMIKEIVTAHRGETWVKSGLGKGFTIGFSLPLGKPALSKDI